MRTMRCCTGAFVTFVLMSLVTVVPAAAAPTIATGPTLAGELFTGTATKASFACVIGSHFTVTYTGTTTGPFVGMFTETVSGTIVRQGKPTTLTTIFSITSSTGTVHGHATLTGMFACGQRARSAGLSFNPANGTYTAKITASAGTYHDKGTSNVTKGFVDLYKGKLTDGSLDESFTVS